LASALRLTLDVGELRPGAVGRYSSSTRTVTIAEAAQAEDPRFVATLLAHEIRHASDADLVALGLLPADCLELETRGFEAQAIVSRAFWPDELPSGTVEERQLAALVRTYERIGLDGIRIGLAGDSAYHEMCDQFR
jgi:hypothetical protein